MPTAASTPHFEHYFAEVLVAFHALVRSLSFGERKNSIDLRRERAAELAAETQRETLHDRRLVGVRAAAHDQTRDPPAPAQDPSQVERGLVPAEQSEHHPAPRLREAALVSLGVRG